MQKLVISLRVFITCAVLLGLIYPLFIMGIGHVIFPHKANGSLLMRNDKVIGSTLIAQEFTSPKYFHSRFSAINYNATSFGGSNLAPSSKKLIDLAKGRIQQIRLENGLAANSQLPADIVLDSASGLDPHISYANAMLQLHRIAKCRGLSEDKVKRLIRANTTHDFVGLWGREGVNVLELNLALDDIPL
ncbi:K(+) transporting P-type ATPase subunit KdpC [Gammaproteobacteria bacterium]